MEETTAHIIEKCRKGSRSAQIALYNRFAGKLYAACLYLIGNREEAEEAMQDTFLKIFAGLDLPWTDTSSEKALLYEAWMRRIAVRTAIDYLRKKKPVQEEIPADYAETEEEEENQDDETALSVDTVKKNMLLLPDGDRTVLSLYLFEGYDMEEIASILDIQPSSVRSRYLRAKRKLLKKIHEELKNG